MNSNIKYVSKAGHNADVDIVIFALIILRFIAQLNLTYKIIPYATEIAHIASIGVVFFLSLSVLMLLRQDIDIEIAKYRMLILFVFYIVIRSLFNTELSMSIFVDMMSYSLILVFLISFSKIYVSPRYWRTFVLIFVVILILQLFFSFHQQGWLFFSIREHRGKIGSFLGHANSASFFLCLLVILVSNAKGVRPLFMKLLFIILILLLGTRSIWLVTFFLLIGLKISKYFRDNKWPVILCFVILLFGTFVYMNHAAQQPWSAPSWLSGNSVKWRVRNWLYYIDRIDSVSGLFFGQGLASHENVTLFRYKRFVEVHNDYLRIMFDLGITGLFLFFLAEFSIFRFFLAKLKAKKEKNILIAVFLAKLYFLFFDNFVTNFCGVILYFFIICKYQEIANEIELRGREVYSLPASCDQEYNTLSLATQSITGNGPGKRACHTHFQVDI